MGALSDTIKYSSPFALQQPTYFFATLLTIKGNDAYYNTPSKPDQNFQGVRPALGREYQTHSHLV